MSPENHKKRKKFTVSHKLSLGFLKFTRIKIFLNCNTIPRDRFLQTGRDTGSRILPKKRDPASEIP